MTLAATCLQAHPLADWLIQEKPWYQPVGNEVQAFEAAHAHRLPLLLKGPTGCGKSRFVQYMAWCLGKPLITVACHDDLAAHDLTGRWLLDADGTRWSDGPLTLAARYGAICYLDEVFEARSDTIVALHPLADARRILPLEKRGEVVHAHADFHLVASFNPGYQAFGKMLKPSTRQRFTALTFGYPDPVTESRIISLEAGIDEGSAKQLAALGERTRRLVGQGLEEGASTRMLVHAATLMKAGLPARSACMQAIVEPLSEDATLLRALREIVSASLY
ncbi:CbbQ/NirQ/NorQ/GpvN family protein [Noviherbaspirillum sp. Root189]|uniref:CbbQ/NirQ/NorQ/GpvN family protein n=1 Tax=Noviherbaspirillum sp. Root189 TaxID=1736487 RepID=UPI00070E6840|nr:CbbQ/NirQ/NorQ/GpvN family protein [Noviherbaspirillum sp. Root189]KRB67971.1 AAA family ATPase [Noviherbaspirillum sp. Root189]